MTLKDLGNVAVLVLVAALAVMAIGLWARVMVKLFCIGYGC